MNFQRNFRHTAAHFLGTVPQARRARPVRGHVRGGASSRGPLASASHEAGALGKGGWHAARRNSARSARAGDLRPGRHPALVFRNQLLVCHAGLPCWSAVLVCHAGLLRRSAVLVCRAGLPRWSAVLVCRAGDGDDVASGPSDATMIYAPSNPEDQGMLYLDRMRGQTPIANPQFGGRRRSPEKRVAGKRQISAAHFLGAIPQARRARPVRGHARGGASSRGPLASASHEAGALSKGGGALLS